MEVLALILALPLLAAFGVQWGVLAVTRRGLRPLRWMTLAGVLAPFALAAAAWNDGSSLFIGLSRLAAFLCTVVGGCALLGWGLAWGAETLWKERGGKGRGEGEKTWKD